jgi:outer membrane protein OmpA-like peptidoglycan-associated protein
MRSEALIGLMFLSTVVVLSGCGKSAYFGVSNRSLGVPGEFGQTEAAVEKAERSPGAQYAPDKIAQAKELGTKAVETYWGCRTAEAMAMLAEARRLAGEAELAKAPPRPAPVVAKPAPAKVTPVPPKPMPVAVPPRRKRVIIYDKPTFGFDSADVSSEARVVLDEQVGALRKDSKLKLVITGHTCSVGPAVSQGVASGRLKAVGYGEARPIGSNDTREGRAQNRRIELIPIWK